MIITMKQKITGLSRDLIIHPGETLLEIIEDRKISQKELALRTGFTENHISNVINGKNSISTAFAKNLEYVLGIHCSFWNDLQTNYNIELEEFEESNNISQEEIKIAKNTIH